MKYAVNAISVPEPLGHASQGTTAGRFVFISGQLPVERTAQQLVSDDIALQVEREIMNIEAALSTANCTLDDVAQATVYLTDLTQLETVDEVWRRYFTPPAPARSVVEVAKLPLGAQVQIDCVACR